MKNPTIQELFGRFHEACKTINIGEARKLNMITPEITSRIAPILLEYNLGTEPYGIFDMNTLVMLFQYYITDTTTKKSPSAIMWMHRKSLVFDLAETLKGTDTTVTLNDYKRFAQVKHMEEQMADFVKERIELKRRLNVNQKKHSDLIISHKKLKSKFSKSATTKLFPLKQSHNLILSIYNKNLKNHNFPKNPQKR